MKKLLSTRYSAGAFNTAMLLLRLVAGGLMLQHGYEKMVNFAQEAPDFLNFLGIGSRASLCLAIFAEFFCSLLIIIGLFTRLAAIPLIITMCVAIFMVHHGDFAGKGQTLSLFLCAYLVLLLTGAGKVSVDAMIGK